MTTRTTTTTELCSSRDTREGSGSRNPSQARTRKRPQRLQRERRRGWKKPPEAVIADRTSRWGNPHRCVVGKEKDPAERARVVELFRRDLLAGELDYSIEDVRRELAGFDLLCWCPLDGQPCHADVLLEIANPGCPVSLPGGLEAGE